MFIINFKSIEKHLPCKPGEMIINDWFHGETKGEIIAQQHYCWCFDWQVGGAYILEYFLRTLPSSVIFLSLWREGLCYNEYLVVRKKMALGICFTWKYVCAGRFAQ